MRARFVFAIGCAFAGCEPGNAPHLSSVSPTTVTHGQTVTLTGERLCQKAGVNTDGTCAGAIPGTVDFSVDGPVRADVTTWTDTQVVLTVPVHAPDGSTEIYLTSSGVSSNALDITVTAQ